MVRSEETLRKEPQEWFKRLYNNDITTNNVVSSLLWKTQEEHHWILEQKNKHHFFEFFERHNGSERQPLFLKKRTAQNRAVLFWVFLRNKPFCGASCSETNRWNTPLFLFFLKEKKRRSEQHLCLTEEQAPNNVVSFFQFFELNSVRFRNRCLFSCFKNGSFQAIASTISFKKKTQEEHHSFLKQALCVSNRRTVLQVLFKKSYITTI